MAKDGLPALVQMTNENTENSETRDANVDDSALSAASGGALDAGSYAAAFDAAKRIYEGATAGEQHPVPDVKVFTQEEWDNSSWWYRNGIEMQGAGGAWGGDRGKIHYRVVANADEKTKEVNRIKDANNGISNANPGW